MSKKHMQNLVKLDRENDPRRSVSNDVLEKMARGAAYVAAPSSDTAVGKKPGRKVADKGVRQGFLLQQHYIDGMETRLETLPRNISKTDLVKIGLELVEKLSDEELKELLDSRAKS